MPLPLKYRRLQDAVASLGPDMERGMEEENITSLDRTAGMRDMQDPRQQAVLQQERQRLMQQQAQQQFVQRLQQRLNPRIGTPEDSDPQAARAAFMARLMSRMRGQVQAQQPGMQWEGVQ